MKPTETPLFTHLLAQDWAEKNKTPKPTALGTMLRYSGAHGCGRRAGYDWFEATPTEPYTMANSWPMGLGTMVHEAVQQAIAVKYPEAQFELASQVNGFISGSCDAFIPNTTIGNVLFELKTMGNYAFDQQTGIKRSFGKLSTVSPKGPKRGAIAQAGMNALGIEDALDTQIDYLILGSLTFEVVSVKMARQSNLEDFARFGAEFHIPRETWEPIATEEIDRLNQFAETLDLGYLPDRWAKDDDGNVQHLDPLGDSWQCSYCPFQTLCAQDRDGQIRVLDSLLVRRPDLAHLNPLESNEADSDAFIDFLLEKEPH